MAQRLVEGGHDVIVWNRGAGKSTGLAALGARVAVTPADVAEHAELVGLCLASHDAVEEVAFGPAGLVTRNRPQMAAVADFTTGSVEAARGFASRAAARGVGWVDAPVSGGVPAATRGALTVFAGGDQATIDRLAPLFAPLSVRLTRMGDSGAGQAAKLCNQALVAAAVLALAETVAMARRAGIDPVHLLGAMAGGFADSAPLRLFGPRMAEHRFEPRLGAIAHRAKDARLAEALAIECGAETPILHAVRGMYAGIVEGGTPAPEQDLSALVRLYEDRP